MEKYGEVTYKNRKLFLKLYWGMDYNYKQIADLFNAGVRTMYDWRSKHKIVSKGKNTHRSIVREIYDLVGCEYSILSKFNRTKDKVVFKHNLCGNVFEMQPYCFIKRGQRCPICGSKRTGEKLRKTDKQFKREVKSLVGDDYTFLEKYKSAHEKLKVKHHTCGRVYKVEPNGFLRGNRCVKCQIKKSAIRQRKTQQEFEEEVFKLMEGEYVVIGKYINNRTPLSMYHKDCGNTYSVRPESFLRGSRCPFCSFSKGEDITVKTLEGLCMDYQTQKVFSDCLSPKGNVLRFDFYIPSKNILIEYNGKQHYQYVEFFYDSEEDYEYRLKCDEIKRKYCEEKGVRLLEIPYTEKDNIKQILRDELCQ